MGRGSVDVVQIHKRAGWCAHSTCSDIAAQMAATLEDFLPHPAVPPSPPASPLSFSLPPSPFSSHSYSAPARCMPLYSSLPKGLSTKYVPMVAPQEESEEEEPSPPPLPPPSRFRRSKDMHSSFSSSCSSISSMAEIESPATRAGVMMRMWGSENHLEDLIVQAEERIACSPDLVKVEGPPKTIRRSSSLSNLSDAGHIGRARLHYNRCIGKEIDGYDVLPKLKRV
eukprot:768253-Hanusia_phi.AAC.4